MFQEDISLVYKIAREIAKEEIAAYWASLKAEMAAQVAPEVIMPAPVPTMETAVIDEENSLATD